MKRYAISWYDHFTMSIKMEITDAENDLEALKIAYKKLTRKSVKQIVDIPTIKALARSCDGAIEAIEIYEPEYLPATEVIKRFIKGAYSAIPTKSVPQVSH